MSNDSYTLLCLMAVVIVIQTANANPIATTYFNYTFTETNVPIQGPINFTINCYGFPQNNPGSLMSTDNNSEKSKKPPLLFSDSTNCTPGGRSFHKNNCDKLLSYTWYREEVSGRNFSSCDIEGVYQKKSFAIKNFTTNLDSFCAYYGPYPSTRSQQNEDNNFFLSSRNADYCFNLFLMNYAPCKLNKRYLTPEEDEQCYSKAIIEEQKCFQLYGHPVNISDEYYLLHTRVCEFPFEIPSDNQTSELFPVSNMPSHTNQSPVASLYCTLLSLFGAKC